MSKQPNFFVVGAAKAGTTSLYTYLRRTSTVFMPAMKEPHFFSPSAINSDGAHKKVSDWGDYLALFDGASSEEAIGEASPSYLWDEQSARLIKKRFPEAKVIILIRDPVERAFSHYLADVRLGWQALPFHQALQVDMEDPRKQWGQAHLYLELGCYTEQVRRYYQNFGREQVKVVLFDDLKANPPECLKDVCSFLKVHTLPALPATFEAQNSAAMPRGLIGRRLISSPILRHAAKVVVPSQVRAFCRDHLLLTESRPAMDPQARESLEEYYKEETRDLQALLNCKVPWA